MQQQTPIAPDSWSERWKPAASMHSQVLLAGLLWSAVGSALGVMGVAWTVAAVHGASRAGLHLLAIAAGWLKGRLVLSRSARRTLARIEERGNGRCLGGFLSWWSWLLVASMILVGRLLRSSGLPGSVLGPIYLAIGVALVTGSLTFWQARRRLTAT